jgi:EpsI family protein
MNSLVSVRYAVTAALLAGTVLITSLTARRVPQILAHPLEQVASDIDGWKAVEDLRLDARVLKSLTPTSHLVRRYQKADEQAELFIAYYAQQRAGESMHSPKHCLPGGGWEIWKYGSVMVPVDGAQVKINKYSIQNAGVRKLMFYWYQSRDRIVASEYIAKFLLARDTLLTGRTGGSIVRIMLADNASAQQQGVLLSARLIRELRRCLGEVNDKHR